MVMVATTILAARVQYNKAGIYAQDEWQMTPQFKLTYGLRLDGLFFDNSDLMTNNAILNLDYNGRHIDSGKWPNSSLTVSPRIGFVYDVFGDKTLSSVVVLVSSRAVCHWYSSPTCLPTLVWYSIRQIECNHH